MLCLSWSSKDSNNKAAFLNKTEGGDLMIRVSADNSVYQFSPN